MSYLLMLVFFGNSIIKLKKKTSAKSAYLDEILVETLSHYNAASWAVFYKTFIAQKR